MTGDRTRDAAVATSEDSFAPPEAGDSWRGPLRARAGGPGHKRGFPANAPSKPKRNDLEDDLQPGEPLRANRNTPKRVLHAKVKSHR